LSQGAQASFSGKRSITHESRAAFSPVMAQSSAIREPVRSRA
jgi:hypothetical protein